MHTKTYTAQRKSLARPMGAEEYRTWLWALAEEEKVLHPETIGTTAGGNTITGISVGEGGPTVVYLGGLYRGDWLSTAVLLGFLAEYSRKLQEGDWLYRIRLPQLYAHRRLCVIPAVNPDGMGQTGSDSSANGAGAEIAAYFRERQENRLTPERCPEAAALMQVLRYREPSLCCCIRGTGEGGVLVPCQPSQRAGTTGRLLSGLVHLPMAEREAPVAGWYGRESGQPSYEIELGIGEGEE